MTRPPQPDLTDRVLRDVLLDEGEAVAPSRILEDVFARTRRERQAQRLCDLAMGQAEVVMEHQHGSLLDGDASQAEVDPLPVGEEDGRVLTPRGDDHAQLCNTADPPALVMARIDQQPPQPLVEAVRVAEPRKLAPSLDQGLLRRVLGAIRVAEDHPGEGIQPVHGSGREGGERVMVAGHRGFHVGSLQPHQAPRRMTFTRVGARGARRLPRSRW